MTSMAETRLSQIWDVLVKHAGASEDGREAFLACASEYGRERSLEYRFCGSLGFGGKVWLNNGPHPYINCYREDETPERRQIIKVTDAALKEVGEPEMPLTDEMVEKLKSLPGGGPTKPVPEDEDL